MKETLSKATLKMSLKKKKKKMSLVAKYLDRANLVSRLANAAACFAGLIPFVSEKTAFPESNGNSLPEVTCGASC